MTTDPWLQPPIAPGADRLFCFPFAGGNGTAFKTWRPALAPRTEVWAAMLPARGPRLAEPPTTSLADLVSHLTDSIAKLTDKPFAFFGHSLGSLVAFETARELRRRGLPLPEVLWASGAEGPGTRVVKRHLHGLPHDEFIEALREYNGTPSEVLEHREIMEMLYPALQADFGMAERYEYREEPPLDLPIHALYGDADPHVDYELLQGWGRETTRSFSVHGFDGDHFFLFPHEEAITALIAGRAR
ncbi:thioesterase II family protein [Amycolatopsis sp. CA-230715]|uniref:thioesterase II family protein n=1 Tax=Amycolatopsis sp. CA-230715 TaxID=2745196 RepID=UPI001C02F234|nr:alpha/beta fold hydrolase [Amycolatopsis sp. CA-230715]QWF85167.1 Linear gramicidin dehydrogenase LgrE [Amycolatopsis sp. CA-230715]